MDTVPDLLTSLTIEIKDHIDKHLTPLDHRLAAIETNIDFLVEQFQDFNLRLTALENKRSALVPHGPPTPPPSLCACGKDGD